MKTYAIKIIISTIICLHFAPKPADAVQTDSIIELTCGAVERPNLNWFPLNFDYQQNWCHQSLASNYFRIVRPINATLFLNKNGLKSKKFGFQKRKAEEQKTWLRMDFRLGCINIGSHPHQMDFTIFPARSFCIFVTGFVRHANKYLHYYIHRNISKFYKHKTASLGNMKYVSVFV